MELYPASGTEGFQPFLDSIVVSISACHVEGPGSIPGRGVIFSYKTVNVTVTPCRPYTSLLLADRKRHCDSLQLLNVTVTLCGP